MGENTIDNLSIQVTASAEGAAKVFDRLASSAGRVKGAASGAAGGMQDMAQGAQDAGTATATAGEQAGQAQPRIRGVGNAAKDAGDKAKKGASGLATFWQSLKRIAFYRFIRSIIKSIGEAFNYGITNLYQWSSAVNGRFASSMDTIKTATNYLKNSFAAMVSPLVNALAPALDFIIDRVVDVINWFNQLFAVLSGASTYTVAKKVASTWADAGKSAAGSAKKAADDIKRTILGFDEINKLVDNKNHGSGTGSGYSQPATDGSILFEEKPITGGFKGFSNAIENALNDTLSRIGLIISGASLAVGAILTFSGANVPLGLSMMAAGASGLVSIIGMNWDGLSADVKLAIGAVEAVIGGSLLAIGGILAFSGINPALGIAMMAAGAVSLAAAVGLNWDLITGKVSASAKGVAGALSAAIAVVGAILTFTGVNAPLGIAFMATGITGAAVTLNWDYVADKLRGPIGTATAIVSGASLVLGILALIGGAVPLGIGLILAGASGLAATVSANWDNLVNLGKTAIESVKKGWDAVKLVVEAGVELVKKGWTTLTKWVGDIAAKGVKLVKNGWKSLTSWVGDISAKGVKLVKNGWTTITAWVGNIADKGVKLVKNGWTTITAWVGNIADKGVKLVKNGWTTITAWVGNIADKGVKLVKNGWTTITAWVGNIADKGVKLIRDGWTTITAWVGNIGDKGVKLVKTGWTTITAWVGNIADKGVKLVRNGWTTITAWVGNIADKGVKLVRSGWTTITSWVGEIGARSVSLIRSGWTTLADWAKSFGGSVFELFIKPVWDSPLLNYLLGQNAPSDRSKIISEDAGALAYAQQNALKNNIVITADLEQGWYGTPQSALGVDDMNATVDVDMWSPWSYWHTPPIKWLQMDDLKSTVSVDMWTPWWATNRSPLQWLQMDNLVATVDVVANVTNAQNTIKAATNFSGSYKAEGGVFSDNRWTDIPQYAGGTLNAHGSLFLAGEAGPEIVGHVGGRTEVLNKSQIAAAMYSAVQAAMAPVTATMAYAAQSMGGSGTEIDYTGMYDIIRDAVAQALANDSGSREQTQLLRQISDKDFSAEITTSSMNKAQTRMNRRAGVTLVPVGT